MTPATTERRDAIRRNLVGGLATIARLGLLIAAITPLVTVRVQDIVALIDGLPLRFAADSSVSLLISKLVGIAAVAFGILTLVGLFVAVFVGIRGANHSPFGGAVMQAFLIIAGCLAFAGLIPVAILWAQSEVGLSKPILFLGWLVVNGIAGYVWRPAGTPAEGVRSDFKLSYWSVAVGVPATVVGTLIGLA